MAMPRSGKDVPALPLTSLDGTSTSRSRPRRTLFPSVAKLMFRGKPASRVLPTPTAKNRSTSTCSDSSTVPGSQTSGSSSASETSEVCSEVEEEPRRAQGQAPLEDEEMHVRWSRVLKGREATELAHEEILRLLAEGDMPLKHRQPLWTRWCAGGASECSSVEELQEVPEDVAATIDADVPRTQAQWLGPQERRKLRRVLRAVAAEDPATGYCQGMNNIAGVFIMLGFDEDAALAGTRALLKRCCPRYHAKDLGGLLCDAKVVGQLAKMLLPERTQKQLERITAEVPLNLLVSQHFLTLASGNWPLASVARLWDLLLTEGPSALFASFLALLELYLPEVHGEAWEEEQDSQELMHAFRQAALRGVQQDFDTVLQHMRRFMRLINEDLIDELRSEVA